MVDEEQSGPRTSAIQCLQAMQQELSLKLSRRDPDHEHLTPASDRDRFHECLALLAAAGDDVSGFVSKGIVYSPNKAKGRPGETISMDGLLADIMRVLERTDSI